jgi:hypothetical protein
MDRRDFLNLAAAGAVSTVVPEIAMAATAAVLEAPPPDAPWRAFEVVTEVEIWQSLVNRHLSRSSLWNTRFLRAVG